MGHAARISAAAVMECKICWPPYDPAEGDPFRQIAPGTAFRDLPADWSCPVCSAPPAQFMVLSDPGSEAAEQAAWLDARTAALAADFTEVWHARMRDVPLVNKLLRVEAVGFRLHEGRPLGVLVAPWFTNLIQLPAPGEDWSALEPGRHEVLRFPSGAYEFLHNVRETVGGYKACSLFSPLGQFRSQAQAVDVAGAVMAALFDPANRAGTDRAADIRAAREAELAAAEAAEAEADAAPTRRAVITGGLAAAPAPTPAE
jgi:[NiFe] hydrogenase assembly HybE family chaperone